MAAGLLIIGDNLLALNDESVLGHLRRRDTDILEVTTHMMKRFRSAEDLFSTILQESVFYDPRIVNG